MTAYITRRVLLIIPTVFFALSFLFLLFFTLPGDPANLIAGGANRVPDPIQVEQINERYGFNDPLIVQFKNYWQSVLHWDLGESFQTGRSVNDILERAHREQPAAGVLGDPHRDRRRHLASGILSAIRRYSMSDRLTTIVTAGGIGDARLRAGLHPPVHLRGRPQQAGLARVDGAADLAARSRHLVLLLHPDRGAVALPGAAGASRWPPCPPRSPLA